MKRTPLKVSDTIECEHLTTQVGYDDKLQSSGDEDAEQQMSFPETVSDSLCRISWLCKPIVAAAVRGAGLRRSWR